MMVNHLIAVGLATRHQKGEDGTLTRIEVQFEWSHRPALVQGFDDPAPTGARYAAT